MSSKSLNKVTLIGNVTRDPDLRYTPQGNAVCTFGLATNRSWKTDGGELREEAEFHRLVAWNKLAELCSQLCTKGRKIYVEGRLQTRTFTGSDNAQHTITEIVIDDMILLDPRPGAAANGGQGFRTAAPAAGPTQPEPVVVEEPVVEQPAEPVETVSEDSAKEKKPKSKPKAKLKTASASSSGDPGKGEGKAEGGAAVQTEPETPAEIAGTPADEKINIDDIPF